MPQPNAMTIQPDALPLVFGSTTFATTPLPRSTRRVVPTNSAKYCFMSTYKSLIFRPTLRPPNSVPPTSPNCSRLIARNLRLKATVDLPVPGDCITTLPQPSGQPGQVGRAESRRLRHLRTNNWKLHDIGLVLQQRIINRGPAIDAKLRQRCCARVSRPRTHRITPHCIREVRNLQRNTLDGRPSNMPRRGPASNPHNRTASVRIPMRRTEPDKCRHKVNAPVIGNRLSELFNVRRRLDDSQPIAKPRDHGATDKYATFQGIFKLAASLPGNRGKQPILRINRLATCVHQHEATGSIRVLGEPGSETCLPKQRSLLVACCTGNRNARQLRYSLDLAVDFARRANFRKHGTRHAEARQQLIIPLPGVNVHKQCSRRIRSVGHMNLSAGQSIDKPGIDSPTCQLARLGRRAGARYLIENPGKFRRTEIRIEQQARLLMNHRLPTVRSKTITHVRCAAILPHDRPMNRLPRRPVPYHNGLALICDPHRR